VKYGSGIKAEYDTVSRFFCIQLSSCDLFKYFIAEYFFVF